MLDAVAEEVLEEFDAFARLENVKCDEGVRRRVQEVGELLKNEAVLDWTDLEVLESVGDPEIVSAAHARRRVEGRRSARPTLEPHLVGSMGATCMQTGDRRHVIGLACPDDDERGLAGAERGRPAVVPQDQVDDGDVKDTNGVEAVRDEHGWLLSDGLENVKYDSGVDEKRDPADGVGNEAGEDDPPASVKYTPAEDDAAHVPTQKYTERGVFRVLKEHKREAADAAADGRQGIRCGKQRKKCWFVQGTPELAFFLLGLDRDEVRKENVGNCDCNDRRNDKREHNPVHDPSLSSHLYRGRIATFFRRSRVYKPAERE